MSIFSGLLNRGRFVYTYRYTFIVFGLPEEGQMICESTEDDAIINTIILKEMSHLGCQYEDIQVVGYKLVKTDKYEVLNKCTSTN